MKFYENQWKPMKNSYINDEILWKSMKTHEKLIKQWSSVKNRWNNSCINDGILWKSMTTCGVWIVVGWFWYGVGIGLVSFLYHFCLVFVWFWYGFCIVLVSFLYRFGMVLVSFWDGVCIVLVWFWGGFGMVLVCF